MPKSDRLLEHYKSRNGCPAKQGGMLWDARERPASSGEEARGVSTKSSMGDDFERAVKQATSRKHARDKAAAKFEETFGYGCPEGFANIRVHDLKHTFGRRLRATGGPLETRKALRGHKNGDITTHYSAIEVSELLDAVESVCMRSINGHGLVLIRGGFSPNPPQTAGARVGELM